MSQPQQNAKRALGDLAVGIFLFALPLYVLNLASVRATKIFNADLGTPFMIAQDVLRDPRNISYWHFPEAPYFFPDTIQAIILMAVFRDYHTAILVDVGVKVLMFVGITYWLCTLAGVRERFLQVGGVTVLMHLLIAAFHPVSYEMLMTAQFRSYIHSGAFLSSGLAWCLMFSCLRTPSTLGFGSLLLVVFLSVLSDALFVLQWIVPATACCAFLVLSHATIPKRWVSIIGLSWIVGASAYLFGAAINLNGPKISLSVEGAISSLRAFSLWTRDALAQEFLTFALLSAVVLASAYLLSRPKFRRALLQQEVLAVFFAATVVSVVIGTIAVVATDKFANAQSWRYMLSIHWLLVAIPMHFAIDAVISKPALLVAAMGLSIASTAAATGNARRTVNFNDPVAACFSQITTSHGVVVGFGDYWSAKSISAVSNGAADMIPVTVTGEFYRWAYSDERVARTLRVGPEIAKTLTLVNWLDRAQLKDKFGHVEQTIECGGFRFVIATCDVSCLSEISARQRQNIAY